jgi:hypothetical protein
VGPADDGDNVGEEQRSASKKKRCGAQKRQGNPGELCGLSAGWGTGHPGIGRCRLHGGKTRNHKIAAQKAAAEQAVVTYGLPVDISPSDALLQEVHQSAGAARWLRDRVQAIDPEALVWSKTKHVVKIESAGGDDGSTGGCEETTTRASGINVWLELYYRERRHHVDVCKAALQAGVEERLVRIAEQQGALLAQAVKGILAELDLSPEQEAKVAEVVPRHLRSVA